MVNVRYCILRRPLGLKLGLGLLLGLGLGLGVPLGLGLGLGLGFWLVLGSGLEVSIITYKYNVVTSAQNKILNARPLRGANWRTKNYPFNWHHVALGSATLVPFYWRQENGTNWSH